MKLEEMHPVTAPYLTILRSPSATLASRHNAMQWLLMHGFADRLPDDILEQATGAAARAERLRRREQESATPTVRVIAYDEAASDPAVILRAIELGSGQQLDDIGTKLYVHRTATLELPSMRLMREGDIGRWVNVETDESYRARLVDAVCSCRGSVHVLGPDPATWHHCQCGRTPALSAAACETAKCAYSQRQCFFCGTWRDRAKLTEHTALAWTPETGETFDRLYACSTGACPAHADAFRRAALESYHKRQRVLLAPTERYSAEQRPINAAHVAIVDKAPNPECRIGDQFSDLKERFAAIRAAWKGQPPITLDEEIDGVALRDLLELEEDERQEGPGLQLARLLGSSALSPAQRAAVSAYHSAQLRARIAESDAAAEARKLTVIVDRDLDEVE